MDEVGRDEPGKVVVKALRREALEHTGYLRGRDA